MTPKKRLTDILHGGERERIAAAFNETDAATDFEPLPPNTYDAHLIGLDLFNSRGGTPGVKMTFRVVEGDYTGRQFWNDLWLTEAALPMTKRDLAKLGITTMDQIESELPQWIRCRCKVALRRDDDGNEYNRVRKFDVIGIDKPERDAFAPPDDDTEPGDAGESGDTSFDTAQLDAELAADAEREAAAVTDATGDDDADTASEGTAA